MSILLSLPNNLNTTLLGEIPHIKKRKICNTLPEEIKNTPSVISKCQDRNNNVTAMNSKKPAIEKCCKLLISKLNQNQNVSNPVSTLMKHNQKKIRPPITEKEIKQRIERQNLRNLRTRIGIPPRNFNYKYKILEQFDKEKIKTDIKSTQIHSKQIENIKNVKINNTCDISTQIENNDLFKFDEEVTTVVENISSKILHQSLLEITYENELNLLKTQSSQCKENQKDMKINEDEIIEEIIEEEKISKAVRNNEKKVEIIQKDFQNKIAANIFGKKVICSLVPTTLEDIQHYGNNTNSIDEQIKSVFMLELMKNIQTELSDNLPEIILMQIIKEEIQARYNAYQHVRDIVNDNLDTIQDQEIEINENNKELELGTNKNVVNMFILHEKQDKKVRVLFKPYVIKNDNVNEENDE